MTRSKFLDTLTPPTSLPGEAAVGEWLSELVRTLQSQLDMVASGAAMLPYEYLTKRYRDESVPLGATAYFLHETNGTLTGKFVKLGAANATGFARPVGYRTNSTQLYEVTDRVSESSDALFAGLDITGPDETGEYGWILTGGVSPISPELTGVVSHLGEVGWVADDALATNAATTVGRLISNGAELQVLLNAQPSPVNDKTLIGSIERLNTRIEQLRVELASKPDSSSLNQTLQNLVITSITAVNQTVDLIQTQLQKIDGNLAQVEIEQTLQAMADFRLELAAAAAEQDDVRQQMHVRAQAALHSKESSKVWADESGVYAEASSESAARSAVSANDSLASAEASEGFATSASLSEAAALNYRNLAAKFAVATYPTTFENGIEFWNGEAGAPDPLNVIPGTDVTYGAHLSGIADAFSAVARESRSPNVALQWWRVRALMQHVSGPTLAPVLRVEYFDSPDQGAARVGLEEFYPPALTSLTPVWVEHEFQTTGYPWVNPQVVFGGAGTTVQRLYALEMQNITDSKASEASAIASEGSAVNASASEANALTYSNQSATFRDESEGFRDQSEVYSIAAAGSSASASADAALATQMMGLSASVSGGALLANPSMQFIAAAPAGAAPDSWTSIASASQFSRIAGINGRPDALRLVASADIGLTGIRQKCHGVKPGDYLILELDLELLGGTLKGLGILMRCYDGTAAYVGGSDIAPYSVADAAGFVPHTDGVDQYGEYFKTYRWRLLFRFDPSWVGAGPPYSVDMNVVFDNYFVTFLPKELRVDWVSVRATDGKDAQVVTNSGAISTINGAAAFWETIVAAGGGFPAVARFKAGAGGSEIDLAASKLTIYNPSNTSQYQEVARFEGGQAKLNDAIIRRLQVGPRSDSTIYFPVQLKPKIYVGSDGQTVTFEAGKTMGAPPERIVADLTGIPVASGEALDVRATAVSATQFTVYAKRTTPSAPTLQTTAAGTFTGGTPAVRTHKPTVADAYNSYYTFKFDVSLNLYSATEEFGGSYSAIYEGYVEFYVDSGGGWELVGSTYIYKYEFIAGFPPGTQNYTDETYTLNWPNAIGQHGGYEFGIHPGTGANSVDLVDIQYSTQSSGTVTALTEVIPFLVYPPPND